MTPTDRGAVNDPPALRAAGAERDSGAHATLAHILAGLFFTPGAEHDAESGSSEAEHERRILCALLTLLLRAESDGHSCLVIGTPNSDVLPIDTCARVDALGLDDATAEAVRARLAQLAASASVLPSPWHKIAVDPHELGLLTVVRDPLGTRLYTKRTYALESALARMIHARLQAPVINEDVEAHACKFLMEVSGRGGPRLTTAQIAAAARALAHPLTLITGGPGTGKTTLVRAIVSAALHVGLQPEDMAVCAPTGKAAHRLKQALSTPGEDVPAWHAPEPSTLHRLLGYHPGRDPGAEFARHARDPLPHAIVILDEAAMVDLVLMERLLAALLPTARLVLVGDADQLPPVGLGAVFAQLCTRAGPNVVRLSRSFRVESSAGGAPLVACAEAVRTGDFAALTMGPQAPLVRREQVSELGGASAEWLDLEAGASPESILDALWRFGRWEEVVGCPDAMRGFLGWPLEPSPEDRRALERLFLRLDAGRLLAVTRGGAQRPTLVSGRPELATDVETLNVHMQARARRQAIAPGTDNHPLTYALAGFLPGEPVVILHNDYELELYNGDQGVVVRLAGTDALGAAFVSGGGARVFSLQRLANNLALSYVTTVHRAQGSEFDRVCLILPGRDLPLTSRQLIYTALTRARRALLVIGTAEVLKAGLVRNEHRAALGNPV